MNQILFKTNDDYTGLIIRFTLGIIILPHGAQKLFGIFGGYGFTGTMNYFTNSLQLPWIIAFLVIVIEFFGSLSILAGFASRLWSFLIVILFIGIIFSSHLKNGFFMNWFGNQAGEGYEFHLLIIGLAFSVLVNGSGKYSLDKHITKDSR